MLDASSTEFIESMVKEIVQSLLSKESGSACREDGCVRQVEPGGQPTVRVADYPLGKKHPELIKTPTGKKLSEIDLQDVLADKVKPEDVRIAAETLYLQAQIAEQVNRPQFARNLKRAAELTAIPDQRVLEIYNAMRPYRSTKEELLAIADELENVYHAPINAAFIRQAAEVYQSRNRLRK